MVTHQLQVERRTGKVRRPETDVLPLCHATNRTKGGNRQITEREVSTHQLFGLGTEEDDGLGNVLGH